MQPIEDEHSRAYQGEKEWRESLEGQMEYTQGSLCL